MVHGDDSNEEFLARIARSQIFVIEHDWAAVFANAEDLTAGEIILPYDDCMFEMRVNDVLFCESCFFYSDDWTIGTCLWTETSSGWLDVDVEAAERVSKFIHRQVRAVLIMLDAQVATTEIVRAPERLNRKRERLGRLPLRDYHIVKLNRSRPRPLPSADPSGEERCSPRLHFRRGHWRHFANYKTWIKWTLVGEPDLGFIEKHYRL